MSKEQPIQSKGHYINGKWIKGHGHLLESTNPATGKLLWQGTNASDEEVQSASQAARTALASWSTTSFEQRAQVLKDFAQQVEAKRNQLAQLISQETGKPLWESLTEVTAVVGKINFSIQAYQERTWEKLTTTADARACLRYKPQGVVAILGAFNFPAHLSNGHIVPALLAGNTVLYKPSEQTPAVAELIMECWHDSKIPAGVINCLQGEVNTGKSLLAQDIQAVYFTGSYPTGLRIHQQFSDRPEVILALEMGGNNPLVIAEVEDRKAAIYQMLLSSFITSGQRCTCARRLLIPNTQNGDEILKSFIKASQALRVGAYDQQPEPFMGPVISHQQALKHLQAQQALLDAGAEPLLSMRLLEENTGLLSPGIVDMTRVKNPVDEEIFAPFVQIYRYDSFDEAIELANATRYGLAAGLLSDSEEQYQQFFQQVRAGLINWNKPTTGAASNLPFGGVGFSGNHRPSAYFAADYCAYPIASMEQAQLSTPAQLLPGIVLEESV